MFKKFFRGIFTIIGGLLGYEIYEICSYLLVTMNPNAEQEPKRLGQFLFVLLFLELFFSESRRF